MPAWWTNNGGRTYAENTEVMLADPYNLDNPNPLPTAGSPVFSDGATPPPDKFYDRTANYVGAFGYRDWTAGWSSFNLIVPPKAEGILAGDITSDTTLTNDKDYTMQGFVRVQDGATVTIQPGTTIFGDYNSQAALIIKPGGKIMAEGTADEPIIFTSQFTKAGAPQPPDYGDWGGIILLGNAPINPGTSSIEGPGDSYGGTDTMDNSGVMKYVRIEYPGIPFSPDNEINGLTFGGVGAGTTIDYIQVSYSGDDSYEWFGGTVNCKHLIAYRGLDDDFDTDFGFRGKLQFLLSVRDPQVADQAGASNGFESDNDASGSTNDPRTSATFWNVTLIGPAAATTSLVDPKFGRGMHLRRSTQLKINNALIMGWNTSGIHIDGTNTVADAQSGALYVKNSIISGTIGGVNFTSTDATFQTDMPAWWTNNGGRTYAENTEVMLADPFNIDNPNPFPMDLDSPVLTGGGTPPDDGFFDPSANYVGAFSSDEWTDSWSSFNIDHLVSVKEEQLQTIPKVYTLTQNYPNPFNPATKIRFSLPESAKTKLTVYNALGQQVAELVNGFKNAGNYEVTWNASNLSSGIYFYRIESGKFLSVKKMTLLK
jgi:hypothetical protein